MGDLGVTQGQGAESGDEEFLSILSKLGDLEDNQLNIDAELVRNLSNVWSQFKAALSQKRILDTDRVLFRLLSYTAVAVMNGKYRNQIDKELKTGLVGAISGVEDGLKSNSDQISPLVQICGSLSSIVAEPWEYGAFWDFAGSTGELTLQLAEAVWRNEGTIFLEARLEALAKPKKLSMPDIMAKILHILLAKGKSRYGSALGVDENGMDTDPATLFDPYQISLTRYIEYLEVYVLLCSKMGEIFHSKVLIDLCPSVMSAVINSLHSKSTNPPTPQKLLLPKVWKGNESKTLMSLIDLILPTTLERSCELRGVKTLFQSWLNIFMEVTPKEEQLSSFEERIDDLLMKKDKIYCSDYVYVLSEVVLEKFGDNLLTRTLYVDIYIRGMMMDVNLIEKLRTEPSLHDVRLKEEYLRLSRRFVDLSNYFKEFPKTFKELTLTAFSLDPTEELFQLIFPEESPSSSQSVEKDPTSTTSKEDLGLPETVADALRDIAQTPRWGALAHFTKGDELRKLCTQLLQAGSDFLVKEKKLEFVDVDYEKYAHLPSKYDPNDDGIERGYTRPHEARRKRVTTTKRRGTCFSNRSWQRKRPLMNKPQQPIKKVTTTSSKKSLFSILRVDHAKKSEPSKNPESSAVQQVRAIKQHRNAVQNGPVAFGASWNYQKKRNVNKIYEMKYLQPLLPFPGSYDWIPDPKPTSFATKPKQSSNARDNSKGRRLPTAYIHRRTPLQSSGSQQKIEDELLRSGLSQGKITKAFIPGTKNSPRCLQMATSIQDCVPETTESEWNEIQYARGKQFGTNQLFNLYPHAGSNLSPVVKLNKTELGVPPELDELTRQYLSLRASTLKKGNDSSTFPKVNDQDIKSDTHVGDRDDVIYQEKQAMKKVLYNGLASVVHQQPANRRPKVQNPKRKRRGSLDDFKTVQVEHIDNQSQLVSEPVAPQPKDDVPPELVRNEETAPEPIEEMDVDADDHEDILQYELGLVWELDVASKQVVVPLGPQKLRDRCKRDLMIGDALERIKRNLEWKSYTWKDVQDNAKKEAKEDLENALKEEEARKVKEGLAAVLSPPPKWSPQVSSTNGDRITRDQTAMAVGRARKRMSKLPTFFPEMPIKLEQSEFALPTSITDFINERIGVTAGGSMQKTSNSRIGKVKLDPDATADFVPPSSDKSESDEDDEETSYSRSTTSKAKHSQNHSSRSRKYRFYSDETIRKAITLMAEGATIKRAAEKYNINRSALCKRLEILGFRKDGKAFIPPNFLQILSAFKKKGGGGGSSKSESKSGNRPIINKPELYKAIGLVVLGNKSYYEAATATDVPYSTIAYHVNFIAKSGKEALDILGTERNARDLLVRNSSSVYNSTIIPKYNENLLKALTMLGKGKTSFERCAQNFGVAAKDLASAVEMFSVRRAQAKLLGKSKPRNGTLEENNSIKRRSRRGRSTSSLEVDGDSGSGLESFKSSASPSQSESQRSAEDIVAPTSPMLAIASSSPATPLLEAVESEKPKEKATARLTVRLFPTLFNPISKTGLAQKVLTKEVLDPATGVIRQVVDEPEPLSKEDEIISTLPPCTWREEDEAESPEEKMAEEERQYLSFQEFDEQTKDILYNHPDPVNLSDSGDETVKYHSLPVPYIERKIIVEDLRCRPCFVLLDINAVDNYYLNRPFAEASPTLVVSSASAVSSSENQNILDSSRKRSERIHLKPKLDFKSGTPKIVPNGISEKSVVVTQASKRKVVEDAILQNGDNSDSNKKRKIVEKENVLPPTTPATEIRTELTNGHDGLISSPSVPSGSNSLSIDVNGIGNFKSNSVARKRTTQQRRKTPKKLSSDSSDESESDDDVDIDDDPDYTPDEEERTRLLSRSVKQKSGESFSETLGLDQGTKPYPYFEFSDPIVQKSNETNPVHVMHNVVMLGSSKMPPQLKPRPLSRKQASFPQKDPLGNHVSFPPPEVIDISDTSEEEEDAQDEGTEAFRRLSCEENFPDLKTTINFPPSQDLDDEDDDEDEDEDDFGISPDATEEEDECDNDVVDDGIEHRAQEAYHYPQQQIVEIGGPMALSCENVGEGYTLTPTGFQVQDKPQTFQSFDEELNDAVALSGSPRTIIQTEFTPIDILSESTISTSAENTVNIDKVSEVIPTSTPELNSDEIETRPESVTPTIEQYIMNLSQEPITPTAVDDKVDDNETLVESISHPHIEIETQPSPTSAHLQSDIETMRGSIPDAIEAELGALFETDPEIEIFAPPSIPEEPSHFQNSSPPVLERILPFSGGDTELLAILQDGDEDDGNPPILSKQE